MDNELRFCTKCGKRVFVEEEKVEELTWREFEGEGSDTKIVTKTRRLLLERQVYDNTGNEECQADGRKHTDRIAKPKVRRRG